MVIKLSFFIILLFSLGLIIIIISMIFGKKLGDSTQSIICQRFGLELKVHPYILIFLAGILFIAGSFVLFCLNTNINCIDKGTYEKISERILEAVESNKYIYKLKFPEGVGQTDDELRRYTYTIIKYTPEFANVPREQSVGPPLPGIDEGTPPELIITGLKEGDIIRIKVRDRQNNREWKSRSCIKIPVSTIEFVED